MIKKRKNDLNFCSILEGLQTNVCEVFSIAVISGFTACKFTMVVYIVKDFYHAEYHERQLMCYFR